MYATLLLMSSTLGGDVAPAPGAVAHPGHGCIGAPGLGCTGVAAPACCDTGGHGRAGLLDRIRARHAAKGDCCGPTAGAGCLGTTGGAGCYGVTGGAGCYGAVAAPAGCCDTGDSRGHRERRLFGHHRKSSDCCPDACATGCPAPCALPGQPGVVAPPGGVVPPPVYTPPGGGTTPPKEMPKPKDVKPTKSKDEEVSTAAPVIPVPSPLPSIPAAPVAGNGTPY